MLLWFALSPALADAPGHYHPDDIAAQSQRFAQAAEVMGPAFEQIQTDLSRVGADLQDLERNTAFVGPAAPEALAAWTETTRRAVTGQYLQIQRHVDLLQEDYANVFSDAVNRAIASVGANYTLTECTQSSSISSMLRRSSSGGSTTCTGDNLNAAIAAHIDEDGALADDLAEINAIPWPTISIEPAPQPVHAVTGTGQYISLSTLAAAYLDRRADVHLENFEDALAPLEDGLNEGDSAALEQAAALKEAYLAALATDGGALMEALNTFLTKAGRRAPEMLDVGLCANPSNLGGCPGEDITAQLMPQLEQDGKFQKAMSRL